MTPPAETPRVVVIGGGISGLAAAFFLTRSPSGDGPAPHVTVLEATERAGGKIRTEPFAGVALDTGADSFLARVPAGAALSRAVGLGDDLVAPDTGAAWMWTRGRLRRLPAGLVLGAPTDLPALARSRVLTLRGSARVALDLVLPTRPGDYECVGGDLALGQFLRSRLGTEAQQRLIDPLLGGINAGRTETMSMDVVAPQIAAAATGERSLVRALRAKRPAPTGAPVFLTVTGGLTRLVDALVAELRTAPDNEFCSGQAATRLVSAGAGRWAIETSAGRQVEADAVIIALPAPAASQLLATLSPTAASALSGIDYSSVALTTFAYPASALPGPLKGSGFLVPRVEGRLMTACTWASSKWPHLASSDQVLLRVSAGRAGDERALALDDDELIARLHEELIQAMGIRSDPTAVRVHRWLSAFPQYEVGHLGRMDAVSQALACDAPGVTVTGAMCRGVGISTCISGAQTAATWAAGFAAREP